MTLRTALLLLVVLQCTACGRAGDQPSGTPVQVDRDSLTQRDTGPCRPPALPTTAIYEEANFSGILDLRASNGEVVLELSDSSGNVIEQVIDGNGAALRRRVVTLPPGAHVTGRAADDRGVTLFTGHASGSSPHQRLPFATFSAAGSPSIVDVPSSGWPRVAPAFNPQLQEWGGFSSDTTLAFSARLQDGGVRVASEVAPGRYLADGRPVAFLGDRYAVAAFNRPSLGAEPSYELRLVSPDGVSTASLPVDGKPVSVTGGPGGSAGILIETTDGGSLGFAEVGSGAGSVSASTILSMSSIYPRASAIWDSRLNVWHVVWAKFIDGDLWLATVTPGQGITRITSLGCQTFSNFVPPALAVDGNRLFVAWTMSGRAGRQGTHTGVLRVDL